MLDKTKEIPRVGDIWIPYFTRSLNQFTIFLMFEIEVLFQAGDRIIKVEGLMCWKLWQNVEFQQAWQLDSLDEKTFSPLPKKFKDLIPVTKEEQHEFFE